MYCKGQVQSCPTNKTDAHPRLFRWQYLYGIASPCNLSHPGYHAQLYTNGSLAWLCSIQRLSPNYGDPIERAFPHVPSVWKCSRYIVRILRRKIRGSTCCYRQASECSASEPSS